jgi:hypothetical protein
MTRFKPFAAQYIERREVEEVVANEPVRIPIRIDALCAAICPALRSEGICQRVNRIRATNRIDCRKVADGAGKQRRR